MKLSKIKFMQESISLLMVKLLVKTTYTTTVDTLMEWTLGILLKRYCGLVITLPFYQL